MHINARDLALVACGGAIGASLRYLVGKAVGPQAEGGVPWHTLVINLTGAFVLGLLVALAARHGWPGWWRPLLAVGVLGGYTTFSAYSLETVELLLTGNAPTAFVYAFGSLCLGVLAAWGGLLVGRAA